MLTAKCLIQVYHRALGNHLTQANLHSLIDPLHLVYNILTLFPVHPQLCIWVHRLGQHILCLRLSVAQALCRCTHLIVSESERTAERGSDLIASVTEKEKESGSENARENGIAIHVL